MALKFWLGGQRSDRAEKLIEYILSEAENNTNVNYLFVVPEQFTLSTQRALVEKSARHGILNIDVLSFMRLAHRISDEVGSYDQTVTTLDDMGKNLIIQLLANRYKDDLQIFGKNVDKIGFISKIKSIISEFMQYGIKRDKVLSMIQNAQSQKKSMLVSKLEDINLIYGEFLNYIKDKYTTTEETLERVSSILFQSDTIKESVIIFDGFTGFTPVQTKMIATLMEYAKDIHVSLLYDDQESKELFLLSKRTINNLRRIASDRQVLELEEYISNTNNEEPHKYIFAALRPEEEARMIAIKISELVRNKGYRYRDIAIVTGDIDGIRQSVGRIFPRYDIPYFVDKTEPLLLNPFVEFIRAIIDIFADNFSYEAMFRYIKSGMTDIEMQDIDLLDNYCLATGVKGYKGWHSRFVKPTKRIEGEKLLYVEEVREKVISNLDYFAQCIDWKNAATKCTVRDLSVALYKIIELSDIENKLKSMSEKFLEQGNLNLSKEYDQVYVKVMNVLEELVLLVGDEKITIREYGDLVDAGLDEIRIGVAPRSMDYVQIGDLTRSRVGDVRALFIMSAIDGVIPQISAGGGIINEAEKEFLLQCDESLMLAPTAREDVFTQRLYLYMAMNKPREELYLTYSRLSVSGKSQMPSYIIDKIMSQDRSVKVASYSNKMAKETSSKEEAYLELCRLIYAGGQGELSSEELLEVKKQLRVFIEDEEYSERVKALIKYILINSKTTNDDSIGRAVANVLYGKNIALSVTRLETYANCAYQYYLKYGLKLEGRELFGFEASDMGNIFHDSLSEYSEQLARSGYNWKNITDDVIDKFMEEAVDKIVAEQHMSALYSTARSTYMINRIKRIMKRTAYVVTSQVRRGEFEPKYFEIDFAKMDNLASLNIKLTDDEMMHLYGRIDRVDTCEKDDGVYVKIIDYKSSNKSMDMAAVYEGRQLQLLVYLNAAMEYEGKRSDKKVIPAGVLYYHIDDPVISQSGEMSDEEIKDNIAKKLRLVGLLNSDDDGKSIDLMDKDLGLGSTVLNVSKNKDGSFRKSKQIITGEDFDVLSKYVNYKISSIGKSIIEGDIEVPIPDGKERFSKPDCSYCEFKTICDNKIVDENNRDKISEDSDSNSDGGEEGESTFSVDDEDFIQKMRKITDKDNK